MNVSKQIKAVIFDVDGLMIDSEPSWHKAHSEFLEKNNISLDSYEREKLRGIGLKQLIVSLQSEFKLEKSVDELLAEYREIFYRNFSESGAMKAIEGVEEVVRSFYEQGFQLAIATGGHSRESMKKMLEAFNLLKYFQLIVSGDEAERGKPHPDVFLLAAKELGRAPAECLVLEDSINGVKAGKAAGMTVWGVNKIPKVYDGLRDAGVDAAFYDIKELI